MRPNILLALATACHDDPGSPDGARAIARENSREGTRAWQISTPATAGQIEAYAPRPSWASGSAVPIHVSASAPYTYRVFRMGWYGGKQGRLVSEGQMPASHGGAPSFDPITGLVEARWAPTFHLDTAGWLTGAYLVQLTQADGLQTFAVFVLRDDSRTAEVGVQVSTATWQAYNRWGGESLYHSEHGLPGSKARVVSYDRPYHHELGYGSGTLQSQELHALSWLESQGYDVEYFSSHDIGGPEGGIEKHRLLVLVGHDEYGTLEEHERLAAAPGRGVSLAFLTGNTLYWQVRYGDDGRTMACYKDRPEEDPLWGIDGARVATRFRDPPVSLPENAVTGVMSFGDVSGPSDWVVAEATHWAYDGTGVATGDVIPKAVGFEWDGLVDNGHTPEGLVVLAASDVPGSADPHHATIFERGDAFVFAAGTIYLSRRLLDEPRMAQMMKNLLARAGATPYVP